MRSLTIICFALFFGSSAVAMGTTECTDACKVGLINAEFEFAHHSGSSASQIADDVFTSCGKNTVVQQHCAKKITPSGGTIEYVYYASCVHEQIKKDCSKRYDANR